MTILGLDIGSSSVKAAILRDGKIYGRIVQAAFATRFDGPRVEVEPEAILKAIRLVIRQFGPRVKSVDVIIPTGMAPSWIAMDSHGRPITSIVTHQDRRSIDIAREIEGKIGKSRHLNLTGNRPVPGGISSTTWAWFNHHEPIRMQKADLVGHLNTYLHRTMTGARVTDPSNASFMGVYNTLEQSGWNDELCDTLKLSKSLLPDVIEANQIGGTITKDAARKFGLTAGTPMFAGLIDTSSAMLLAGAKVGQLLNVSGSTDVLALCTNEPRPHERLLTRALGVGKKWLQVSTLAAAGSALKWAEQNLYCDLSDGKFHALLTKLAARKTPSKVRFDPYLAGERTNLEQRTASFIGLTLSTTRDDMLAAMIEALAWSSAERLDLLDSIGTPIKRQVIVSGGLQRSLSAILQRDWPGKWKFKSEDEATLRGLGMLSGS